MLTRLLLACVVFPLVAHADLQFKAHVTQNTDHPGKDPATPGTHETHDYDIEVVLGRDYFYYRAPDSIRCADFKTRRLIYGEPETKQFEDYSLFSDLGFRIEEFPNRLMQYQAFKAAGVKDNPFDPVLLEQLFSLRGSEPQHVGPPTQKGRTTEYTHAGKPLFAASKEGHRLTPDETSQFVRFLRYVFPLHPDILDHLREQAVIPKEFDTYRYNFGTDHFHVVVSNVTTHADRPKDWLTGYQRQVDPVEELCAKRAAIDSAEFRKRCDALLTDATAAAEKGRYLDFLLGVLEYGLCTGNQQSELLARYRAGILMDPRCVSVFRAIATPKDAKSAEEQTKTLLEMVPHTRYGEALKIFAANNAGAMHDASKAIGLFIEALTANPCITGAWKDLGDMYYMSFEAPSAWQCWDTGRLIVPHHPNFKPIDELEQRLLQEHPEFF